MKLSVYAKQLGVTYKTAWRLWKAGKLDAYQLPTGTIIIKEKIKSQLPDKICIYSRVSSSENKDNLKRQTLGPRFYIGDHFFLCKNIWIKTKQA